MGDVPEKERLAKNRNKRELTAMKGAVQQGFGGEVDLNTLAVAALMVDDFGKETVQYVCSANYQNKGSR